MAKDDEHPFLDKVFQKPESDFIDFNLKYVAFFLVLVVIITIVVTSVHLAPPVHHYTVSLTQGEGNNATGS